MAGTAKLYLAVEVTSDGKVFVPPGLSVNVPREWSTNGSRPPLVLPFTIPKRTTEAPYPDEKVIFTEDMCPDFTHLAVYINKDGDSIHLAEIVDAPVSDSDTTAAGTAERANVVHVEWNAPYLSGCHERLVNTSLTVAAGLDVDNRATILTDAGTTVGRLYALQAVTFQTNRDVTGYVVAFS